MTLLRGRRDGLEVMLTGSNLDEALADLEAHLYEQPAFYRGSSALANFGSNRPSEETIVHLQDVLGGAGITLRALCGSDSVLEALALAAGLQLERAPVRDE
ncbi:MAG: hypothetical protein WA814_05845, partial [Candidatus Baltobacteraceae bacterium]